MNKEKVKGFWKGRREREEDLTRFFFGRCSTGEYVGIMDTSVSILKFRVSEKDIVYILWKFLHHFYKFLQIVKL